MHAAAGPHPPRACHASAEARTYRRPCENWMSSASLLNATHHQVKFRDTDTHSDQRVAAICHTEAATHRPVPHRAGHVYDACGSRPCSCRNRAARSASELRQRPPAESSWTCKRRIMWVLLSHESNLTCLTHRSSSPRGSTQSSSPATQSAPTGQAVPSPLCAENWTQVRSPATSQSCVRHTTSVVRHQRTEAHEAPAVQLQHKHWK